uniref:Hypoxia inducible factor 1 subunit alpha, like n=1 Tax=Fundulus heteroclitus TaxID=8078 RepID=A0A3Q2PYL9_FUNHE
RRVFKTGSVAVLSSSEQRKLRSRDAARCRRSQETEVFYELARTLPLPRRVCTHLDKAGIMRVTLSFLRMQQLLRPGKTGKKCPKGFQLLSVLKGLQISCEGPSRAHCFGAPLGVRGLSKKLMAEQPSERNFFLRMKSTLTTRGRTVNIKSATWKVLHCTGHIRPFGGSSASPPAGRVMTLLCEPIPHPSSVEFPLDTCTFLTRHTMDLRFTHCEGRVTELVGYKPEDLIGRSAYEFYHAVDCDRIKKSLHTLLSKGQVNTSRYRFLANGGGFVWAETQATVLYNNKTSQPEAVVCLNFILSAVEQPDVVFSVEQTRCGVLPKTEPLSPDRAAEDSGISDTCESDAEPAGEDSSSSVKLFLKLKERPEELLQLEPEAGDATASLAGGPVELSFASPPGPDVVPDHPKDLCSPQLRQLLSPIFDGLNPSSSPAASSEPDLSPCEDEVMDTSGVEKFFTVCPEETQRKKHAVEVRGGRLHPTMGRESLKPVYAPLECFYFDCFVCLSFRTHDSDREASPQLLLQDKRQKQEPSSIEEDLLLSHRLLGSLEDSDQPDLILVSGRSQLLTDRDPVLGGVSELCDTAALMRDIFIPRPADLSPPLSPMT